MENSDIAQILGEMADLLELTGGNPYKVRAYRQAAQVVDTLPGPVSEPWRKGALSELPAIGERIATKIDELLLTGHCAEHDKLAGKVPPGVLEMLRLEGVGPKTVAAIWKELGATDLDALLTYCQDGRLLELKRMGAQRVKAIREAIDRHRARAGRTPLHRAVAHAETLLARLRRVPGVRRAEAAGSVRRRRETVGDLDVLVSTERPEAASRAFLAMPEVAEVLAQGPTRSSVRLRGGLQVDLRVLAPQSFGAAMHYFTGSKSHNIALRTRAVHRGLKVSEYGVFDREGHRLSGEREEDVFRAVGLPWIPPELREGAGEIEAAEAGRLPRLVEEVDVLGDLHVHSDASSDCRTSLEELVEEARRLGRRYLAVTDHSRSRPLGLTPDALSSQMAQIRALNRKLGGSPRLLTGIEVDILPDGTLDLPLDLLRELDWVVASIHSHLRDPPEQMTERIVRALRTGVVDLLGHPTGRIVGSRDPFSFDLARVLEVAREQGVALEINAQPERLDLTDKGCRLAKDAG
ncbi:MAG: PHP domain-containing protein, partial [Deltaproteobacteria bacterium]|nr:PHP domain-containing protein [Deltaproteobacteria bacterium]